MHRQSTLAIVFAALLALTPYGVAADSPADPAADEAARMARIAPFVGGWWHHGFSLVIAPDGSGDAEWRTYAWCSDPGVTPPCDGMANHFIVNGGHGSIRLDDVDGQTARGRVLFSNDPRALPVGPIALKLGDYGIATIFTGDNSQTMRDGDALCGAAYSDAPESIRRTSPCGA